MPTSMSCSALVPLTYSDDTERLLAKDPKSTAYFRGLLLFEHILRLMALARESAAGSRDRMNRSKAQQFEQIINYLTYQMVREVGLSEAIDASEQIMQSLSRRCRPDGLVP